MQWDLGLLWNLDLGCKNTIFGAIYILRYTLMLTVDVRYEIMLKNEMGTTMKTHLTLYNLTDPDIWGWRAVKASVIVSRQSGDAVREQKLFNVLSCIFKQQLRQRVPPQLQHTSMDDEITEAESWRLHTQCMSVWKLCLVQALCISYMGGQFVLF